MAQTEKLSLKDIPEPKIDFKESVKQVLAEEVGNLGPLPESAGPFHFRNASLNRVRLVRSFPVLLQERILAGVDDLLRGDGGLLDDVRRSDAYKLAVLRDFFQGCLGLYQRTNDEDVPIYKTAISRLDQLPGPEVEKKFREEMKSDDVDWCPPDNAPEKSGHTPEIYHGRDAVFLYMARKAIQLGLDRLDKVPTKYIYSTSNVRCDELYPRYVTQMQIPWEAYHIDTGFAGTAPFKTMKVYCEQTGREFWPEDVNVRIKLLHSDFSNREGLYSNTRGKNNGNCGYVGRIEDKAGSYLTYPELVEVNGRLAVVVRFVDASRAIQFWSIEQAVVRAFLPREKQTL